MGLRQIIIVQLFFQIGLQQMAQNIYYVGAERELSTDRYSNLRQVRDKHSRIYLRNPSIKEKVNNSKSTSCPKTERSRYSVTLQRLKNKSPRFAGKTLNICNLKPQVKKESQILTIRNASQVTLSSAFHQTSVKPVIKENIKAQKLFRKVQQPRFRQKGAVFKPPYEINRKTQPIENTKENQSRVGNAYPKNKSTLQNSSKKASQVQSQLSLQLYEHYKIQPLRKLFLCTRCYQFTPIIELRAHHLSCRIPLKKQEFVNKWVKIINLLKQIFRQNTSNQLYRLIDRMQWYLSECNIGNREGHILYSSELACVLSLKSTITLSCTNVDDLFWLIETVGDLIETQSIDLQETAFWKICN